MGGMDMGFVNEPSMCGEKTTCPQWMAGEQLYNCENFTKTLRKANAGKHIFCEKPMASVCCEGND